MVKEIPEHLVWDVILSCIYMVAVIVIAVREFIFLGCSYAKPCKTGIYI